MFTAGEMARPVLFQSDIEPKPVKHTKMKFKYLAGWIAAVFMAFPAGAFAQWTTNLGQALEVAKKENKKVLINFTGSDWCPPCIQMKKDVYETQEFKNFASKHLVLVEIDFPKKKSLPKALQEANEELARSYNVRSVPTMFLLDANGKRLLSRSGYVSGGVKGLISTLQPLVNAETAPAKPEPQKAAPASSKAKKEEAPAHAVPPPKIQYDGINLKGISGGSVPLALINNKSLAAGEKAKVKTGNQLVEVLVKEIRSDSVLVQIQGESEPRELKLKAEK